METASSKSVLDKLNHALKLDQLSPSVRRVIIGIAGGTLLLIGIAMIVLPGPAVFVIPLGLALLATEFAWARRYLNKAKDLLNKGKDKISKPT